MKKLSYALGTCLGLVLLMSMTMTNDNPKPLSEVEAILEVLKVDLIKDMKSDLLKEDIQKKFAVLFDEVSEVKAHFNEADGFYYVVRGVQDGAEKMELLITTKSEIDQGVYSYIDFTNITLTSASQSCKRGIKGHPHPLVCQWNDCRASTQFCLGATCGVVGPGGDCIIQ